MASITKLPSGRYQLRYRVTVDGAQEARKESFTSRREAEIRKSEVERLYEPRGSAAPPDLLLTELAARYLKARGGAGRTDQPGRISPQPGLSGPAAR
jgi:hypothetical protein